jgi:DNA-binding MarR family transcriptional regulator
LPFSLSYRLLRSTIRYSRMALMENHVLRPLDVPVAMCMSVFSDSSYPDIAYYLDMSPSTAHESVKRLIYAGLVRVVSERRLVNAADLLEFLEHGVRYAFPAQKRRPKRGVPTAPVVWPWARGETVGAAIEPLIKSAPELPMRCPRIYHLLTVVDAMRIGDARDREVAGQILRDRLQDSATKSQLFD